MVARLEVEEMFNMGLHIGKTIDGNKADDKSLTKQRRKNNTDGNFI